MFFWFIYILPFETSATASCGYTGISYHTCKIAVCPATYIYIYGLRTKLLVWGICHHQSRVLYVPDINIKAEACNLHCGMICFATWSRILQESEPRCASSEFLLTAKRDDIDDYKVRWPPKPPRPSHIQKVSGSIPFRVLSSAAAVAVVAAAAFGGASGHAAGNGGSSGAGAIKWCCCQCISTTGAGGAAGVGTDVVL